MSFARSIGVTAVYELIDSFRSRRVLTVLALYLLVGMGMLYFAIGWIHDLEVSISEQLLDADSAQKPGSVLKAVADSEVYRSVVGRAIDDEIALDHILAMSPIAVIYGWMISLISPLLVMVACSSRIAEDVGSGAVRFVLYRSSRLAWCLGKFVGQSLQILIALLLGALGAWCVALWRLDGFDFSHMASGMAMFGIKAWLYCLAYIGLAFCVSQCLRSPNVASALGVVALIVVGVVSGISAHYFEKTGSAFWQILSWLVPPGHGKDLIWYPGTSRTLPAAATLVVMSLIFLQLGYLRFRRRDL